MNCRAKGYFSYQKPPKCSTFDEGLQRSIHDSPLRKLPAAWLTRALVWTLESQFNSPIHRLGIISLSSLIVFTQALTTQQYAIRDIHRLEIFQSYKNLPTAKYRKTMFSLRAYGYSGLFILLRRSKITSPKTTIIWLLF